MTSKYGQEAMMRADMYQRHPSAKGKLLPSAQRRTLAGREPPKGVPEDPPRSEHPQFGRSATSRTSNPPRRETAASSWRRKQPTSALPMTAVRVAGPRRPTASSQDDGAFLPMSQMSQLTDTSYSSSYAGSWGTGRSNRGPPSAKLSATSSRHGRQNSSWHSQGAPQSLVASSLGGPPRPMLTGLGSPLLRRRPASSLGSAHNGATRSVSVAPGRTQRAAPQKSPTLPPPPPPPARYGTTGRKAPSLHMQNFRSPPTPSPRMLPPLTNAAVPAHRNTTTQPTMVAAAVRPNTVTPLSLNTFEPVNKTHVHPSVPTGSTASGAVLPPQPSQQPQNLATACEEQMQRMQSMLEALRQMTQKGSNLLENIKEKNNESSTQLEKIAKQVSECSTQAAALETALEAADHRHKKRIKFLAKATETIESKASQAVKDIKEERKYSVKAVKDTYNGLVEQLQQVGTDLSNKLRHHPAAAMVQKFLTHVRKVKNTATAAAVPSSVSALAAAETVASPPQPRTSGPSLSPSTTRRRRRSANGGSKDPPRKRAKTGGKLRLEQLQDDFAFLSYS